MKWRGKPTSQNPTCLQDFCPFASDRNLRRFGIVVTATRTSHPRRISRYARSVADVPTGAAVVESRPHTCRVLLTTQMGQRFLRCTSNGRFVLPSARVKAHRWRTHERSVRGRERRQRHVLRHRRRGDRRSAAGAPSRPTPGNAATSRITRDY